ncbi:MAG: hypothetical protein MMC23_002026 [Stictis urceolatum]|nr:hypothetical protein [Stictis urceolata]
MSSRRYDDGSHGSSRSQRPSVPRSRTATYAEPNTYYRPSTSSGRSPYYDDSDARTASPVDYIMSRRDEILSRRGGPRGMIYCEFADPDTVPSHGVVETQLLVYPEPVYPYEPERGSSRYAAPSRASSVSYQEPRSVYGSAYYEVEEPLTERSARNSHHSTRSPSVSGRLPEHASARSRYPPSAYASSARKVERRDDRQGGGDRERSRSRAEPSGGRQILDSSRYGRDPRPNAEARKRGSQIVEMTGHPTVVQE